jgi:hypothetical protein
MPINHDIKQTSVSSTLYRPLANRELLFSRKPHIPRRNAEFHIPQISNTLKNALFIDLCLANEPRPTNGRPEKQAKTPEPRIIYNANINNLWKNKNGVHARGNRGHDADIFYFPLVSDRPLI